MDARKFFFVSLGVLALVLAYHIGASRTEAQGAGQFVGFSGVIGNNWTFALTSSGDVFRFRASADDVPPPLDVIYIGNLLSGPVPVQSQTFSKTKAAHR